MITKEEIRVVTDLSSSSGVPTLRVVKNQLVMDTTGSKFDKRDMKINEN